MPELSRRAAPLKDDEWWDESAEEDDIDWDGAFDSFEEDVAEERGPPHQSKVRNLFAI
jgi:hypothetical protein